MNSATYAQSTAHVWRTADLHPRDLGAARTWARRQLTDHHHLPDHAIDDAVLVVSELLNNVLLNAPGEAEITLVAERDMLTVTCADRDDTPVQSGTLDPASARGAHLVSVDALAYACFIRRRTDRGKRIIALLAIEEA